MTWVAQNSSGGMRNIPQIYLQLSSPWIWAHEFLWTKHIRRKTRFMILSKKYYKSKFIFGEESSWSILSKVISLNHHNIQYWKSFKIKLNRKSQINFIVSLHSKLISIITMQIHSSILLKSNWNNGSIITLFEIIVSCLCWFQNLNIYWYLSKRIPNHYLFSFNVGVSCSKP